MLVGIGLHFIELDIADWDKTLEAELALEMEELDTLLKNHAELSRRFPEGREDGLFTG